MSLNAQKVVFLVAGQSNAQGVGDSTVSIKALPNAFQYCYLKDSLFSISDPAGFEELDFQRANTGSAWPSLANSYVKATGKQLILVHAARGGSSCSSKGELEDYGTWASNGKLRSNAILKTNAALNKSNTKLNGIIWLQGERDANAINEEKETKQEYYDALLSLINGFRDAFGADLPFYIVLTGYYKDHPQKGYNEVRKMQKLIAHHLKKVHVIYKDTHLFLYKNQLRDLIHYNQQALNELGNACAKQIIHIEQNNTGL
jgi:hypothetical protein